MKTFQNASPSLTKEAQGQAKNIIDDDYVDIHKDRIVV